MSTVRLISIDENDDVLNDWPPLLKVPSLTELKKKEPRYIEFGSGDSKLILLDIDESESWPELVSLALIWQKLIEEFLPELNEELDLQRDNPLMKDCPFYGPKLSKHFSFYSAPDNKLMARQYRDITVNPR